MMAKQRKKRVATAQAGGKRFAIYNVDKTGGEWPENDYKAVEYELHMDGAPVGEFGLKEARKKAAVLAGEGADNYYDPIDWNFSTDPAYFRSRERAAYVREFDKHDERAERLKNNLIRTDISRAEGVQRANGESTHPGGWLLVAVVAIIVVAGLFVFLRGRADTPPQSSLIWTEVTAGQAWEAVAPTINGDFRLRIDQLGSTFALRLGPANAPLPDNPHVIAGTLDEAQQRAGAMAAGWLAQWKELCPGCVGAN